ncbi:Pre-mRNA-splicing factor Cef1 [Malassezia pachydermatis]
MNQWARISSLLVRKTPKQCKARWYEWLDPSIKKIEWSREEDEKLLHMAKLMPTQWRTIAPIVGRTATQCLERYQQLLNDAESQDSELGLTGPGEEAGPSADQVLKLRPGEIDPDPESRPAKPDPVDMDEDEKEMLSEARARLANTEGKKAKRKARERALDESRRLSTLQKRRELRAAGILAKGKAKSAGIDYNAEIPFEKQPAPGFYDTTEELAKTYEEPMRRTLQQMEPGAQQSDEEARKRRERAMNKPARHEEALKRMREAEQVTKRRKLALPEAQVGERELEQIVKLGQASEAARALVDHQDGAATEGLLSHYAPMEATGRADAPTPTPMRTTDALVREARELHQRTITQTPLLGGDNAPSMAPPPSVGMDATPRASQVPATPYRDVLGLQEAGLAAPPTPRDAKSLARMAKHSLLSSLASLPAPKNDFDIVVDAAPEVTDTTTEPSIPEDATIRDAREQLLAEEEKVREFARRSLVVQQSLPRAKEVDTEALLPLLASLRTSTSDAQRLVDEEAVRLMVHDSKVFPVPGSRYGGGVRHALAEVSDERLAAARALVQAEVATSLGYPGAKPEVCRTMIEAQAASLERVYATRPPAMWPQADDSSLSHAEKMQGAQARFTALQARMNEVATMAVKGEKTLGKLLGGYQARSRMLAGRIRDAATAQSEGLVRLAALERLATSEPAAGQDRYERLQEDVSRLQAAERLAQMEYKELDAQRAEAQEDYEACQTELEMRRAEMALAA